MRDSLKWIAPATRTGGIFEDGADHYVIGGGRITAQNTAIAMSAPFPIDLDACPHIDTFRAAVGAADETVSFEAGHSHLTVRSKGLTVAVPCLAERPWCPTPSGPTLEAPAGFLEALERVQPFVGVDNRRPFVCQALIAGGMVTATNGVSVVQLWTGWDTPPIHVPDYAIKELLKLKGKLLKLQLSPSQLTFHYEGERWLQVRLYDAAFPWEAAARILDAKHSTPEELPNDIGKAVERIAPFCDKEDQAIYFRNGGIGTKPHVGAGAFLEFPGLPDHLAWSLKPLKDTLNVAQKIAWNTSELKHHFFGDKLRGVTLGRKW